MPSRYRSQAAWLEPRLDRLQDAGVTLIPETVERLRAMKHPQSDEYHLNAWVRECYDAVQPLFAGNVSTDLEAIADRLAATWGRLVSMAEARGDSDSLMARAADFLSWLNLPMPKSAPESRGGSDWTALQRLCTVKWWRRQFATAIPRIVDQAGRTHGLVHRGGDLYLSDSAFSMWQGRQRASRGTLENLIASNDMGQEFTLAELADKSTSNLKNRRIELMVRCRGLEEYAEEIGYTKVVFVTLTAPAKYHAFDQEGIQYARWNGTDPRAVNEYLTGVWARARAAFARAGLNYFGVRVAEPHHDGTPHWHLLMFAEPDPGEVVEATLRRYALAEDGRERGALLHRVTFERITPGKGSAVGYIAKYVAKNIDGYAGGDDFECGMGGTEGRDNSRSISDTADRVRAWASTWGIRQFQFFGAGPVGVWREFRRVSRMVPEPYETARVEACANRYAEFLKQHALHDFRVYRAPWIDPDTGEVDPPYNAFGEVREDPVSGVVAEFSAPAMPISTRLFEWSIRHVSEAREAPEWHTAVPIEDDPAIPGWEFLLASEARRRVSAGAWTRINNCTEPPKPREGKP